MRPEEQIFSIGTGKRKQAARRVDGQWFFRTRYDERGWSKWERAVPNSRPDGAWYNPQAGAARLPKD